MNKQWITDSHDSAMFFRGGRHEPDKKMQLIRILDITGMFETCWLIFSHPHSKYGYPK